MKRRIFSGKEGDFLGKGQEFLKEGGDLLGKRRGGCAEK